MLSRIYQACAWLAIAHLLAVGGFVGYLFATGKLNVERLNQMAIVLRGEFPTSAPAVASQPTQEIERLKSSQDELAQKEKNKLRNDLISERHRRDIEDRNSLGLAIQLDVNRQLEQIRSKEQEMTQQREQIRKAEAMDGFVQTLEIVSEMEPKLARDTLRSSKEADAVQLLMQMDNDKRKKIFNACKTVEEKAWIQRILKQMRGLDGGPMAVVAEPTPGEKEDPGNSLSASELSRRAALRAASTEGLHAVESSLPKANAGTPSANSANSSGANSADGRQKLANSATGGH
ncbi:MAG: hypothetical protein FWC56_04090 [Phycisphaerae bacterium]|nr:hypothetical protein [Phycisphaerae bacterium]